MWAAVIGVGEKELILQGLIMSLGALRDNNSPSTQFVQQLALLHSFLDPDVMDLLILGYLRVSGFSVLGLGVVQAR